MNRSSNLQDPRPSYLLLPNSDHKIYDQYGSQVKGELFKGQVGREANRHQHTQNHRFQDENTRPQQNHGFCDKNEGQNGSRSREQNTYNRNLGYGTDCRNREESEDRFEKGREKERARREKMETKMRRLDKY